MPSSSGETAGGNIGLGFAIPVDAMMNLTLRVTIPQLLEVQPTLVYWQPGEELKAKTITLKAGKDTPVKSINVSSSNPDFGTKLAQTRAGEFNLEIEPPRNAGKSVRTTLTIQPENTSKKFIATAIVAAGPGATPINR